MPLQPGSTLLGVFQILEMLGEGGMGAVFRALDTLKIPPSAVAIKEFRLSFLPSEESTVVHSIEDADGLTNLHFGAGIHSTFTKEKAAELFKREAQILHGFDHPNLPHVSAYFEVGDDRYLVMELIEGHDLDRMLLDNDDTPMPEDQVFVWTDQVLDALEYCHAHEIIHRDIKPANIVINLQGVAYLVDFGIARVLNDPGQPQVVGRTAGFSPFEQYVRRGIIDERSDIYALGATLYNLLTGQVPPIAPVRMDEGIELPPIRQFTPGVSPILESAVIRAMELQPDLRFQSARAMREAIFGPQSLPEIVSAPLRSNIVNLTPDGSGDYSSLQEALDGTDESDVIVLSPGDYILEQPLSISRSARLESAGMDVARIICFESETVATINGNIHFIASNLTFQHKGKAWADVVVVENGEVEFNRCRFTGGVRQTETRLGGSGLILQGHTTGIVHQCEIYGNNGHGIECSNWAKPVIRENQCSQNRLAGIIFSGEAEGEVGSNHCMQNFTGILMSGNAHPSVEENICNSNRSSGITFAANSSGAARHNQCEQNQFHGISVIDQSDPILEHNKCSNNKRDGISFSGAANGTARYNTCLNNGRFGLSVNEQASPMVRENHCSGNKSHDVKR
jgi:eukaryotic-like serine/threonine-protein kinase